MRARLIAAVGGELGRLDLSGIDPPRLRPGSIGPIARALGGASLPLFDRYLVDQHTLAGAGQPPPERGLAALPATGAAGGGSRRRGGGLVAEPGFAARGVDAGAGVAGRPGRW